MTLCKVSDTGLMFWSRHRFDLAAELQVRVRREVLSSHLRASLAADCDGWVTVRGFVIECRALRRPNGAAAFRVSLMLDVALIACAGRKADCSWQWFSGWISGRLFGLN